MTWRQPTAHCHVTKKQNFISTHELTQASHLVRIYLPLLATLLSEPSRNSERSASVAIPVFPYPAQAFDHAVEQRSVAIHPSQCSLESIAEKSFCWSAIWLRPSAKTHCTKLQVYFHGLVIQMFCSQVSTVVISTNSSHLDVAVDHETLQPWRRGCNVSDYVPAPLRIAMARLAVASFLISRLGTVNCITSPFRSTPGSTAPQCAPGCVQAVGLRSAWTSSEVG